MWPADYILSPNAASAQHKHHTPPIFIIGAPRSGTSLLYEVMITRFALAYLSNAAHRFYRTPLAATWLFRSAITNWRGNFTSRYGHIDGWGAPNEGGWIWQRFLEDGDWRDDSGLAAPLAKQLRQLTHGVSSILQAPFINKNVMHSNRLQLMHHIWSNALYIEVQRDIIDNARSIVRAERAEGGPGKHNDLWWSVRPKLAAQYVGKTDTERAIAQVIGVGRDIAQDSVKIGEDKLLRIDYAALCDDPLQVMDQIETFAGIHGVTLAKNTDIPARFPTKASKPLEPYDEKTMADLLVELQKQAQ
ncbi:sulfotransferase [Parasphingorhabdus sp. DH2-15]|uniref:sulfotransferase n=1 Tax=Parasphingorhabdus sp. DH2-15 TaxID=3444112 RepID=UPI003F687636